MTETAMNMNTFEQAMLDEMISLRKEVRDEPAPVRDIRLRAGKDFSTAGLPRRNMEGWRWTDLSALPQIFAKGEKSPSARPGALAGAFRAVDAWRLVFENGVLAPSLSDRDRLPEGVYAGSLRAALRERPELGRHLSAPDDAPFFSLNTALLRDGAFIGTGENAQLDRPLHLIFLNNRNSNVRNLFVLGPNSRAVILETHYGASGEAGDGEYFVNHAADIVLDRGAQLAHYRDQDESPAAAHFCFQAGVLREASSYQGFTLTRGARVSRNESRMHIEGAGAECRLNGVNILSGSQIADTSVVMDHLTPEGKSRQHFRSALNGRSRGIFQGLIRVRKEAQRTDARQEIKAILLSQQAVQNAKPELEILADDVQCAHGATIGQIDEAALFYLRSRGIGEDQGRALLTGAFLEEALAGMQDLAGDGPVTEALLSTIGDCLLQQMETRHDG